jgi:VWFA-related protein
MPVAPIDPSGKPGQWLALFLTAPLVVLLLPAVSSAQGIPEQELKFYTQPYTPPPPVLLQRKVFFVEADVVVRDAGGHDVAGLHRKDFKVYDNGNEQDITQFVVGRAAPAGITGKSSSSSSAVANHSSPTGEQPRFVALFFDDRSTPFSDLRYSQLAAEKFVSNDLRLGDNVGVFTASGANTQDFTTDRKKLLQAIQSLHVHTLGTPAFPPSSCTVHPLGPYAAYLMLYTADTQVRQLYLCQSNSQPSGLPAAAAHPPMALPPPSRPELDYQARAVLSSAELISRSILGSLDAVTAHLAEMQGRRVLVLISSGFFTSPLARAIDEATENALHANIVVNALDAAGLNAPNSAPEAYSPFAPPESTFEKQLQSSQRNEMEDVMAELARDTGGTFFHNNNDLVSGLQEMAAVPEVSYRLGFSPANLHDDGRFHNLKVKVTAPGSFAVRTRRGYYAPTNASQRAQSKLAKFNEEVLKADTIEEIHAQVGALAGRLPSGKTGFQISLRMDTSELDLHKSHGRSLDELSLVTALFHNAKFVVGEIGLVDLALEKKSLENLIKRGINATIVLQVPEGTYRLRVVIEDLNSGKMFATTQSASIP